MISENFKNVFGHLRTFALYVMSVPCPDFNFVYSDEVVIARLQHCEAKGLPVLMMSLGIVPKIHCQPSLVLCVLDV